MEPCRMNWIVTLMGICAFLCAARPALSDDCNNNGIPDDQDISSGTSEDCNLNGIPDECEAYVEHKLTASDAAKYDYFGNSVTISGDVAVIGAYGDDDGFSNSGSAYVYRWDGSSWVEEAKLTASDSAADDYFGLAVAISGDLAVIGAYGNDDAGIWSGSAYVFRFNGSSWVEQAKLTASDAAAEDYFGASVAISGEVAVIGAEERYANTPNPGSAYVFRFNGTSWVQEAKLTASDAADGDEFGCSVSISGDMAVIGAYYDDNDGGNASGSAYVFRFNGSSWTEEAKLTASDAAAYDYFGYSASISGDVAVVGAYQDDDGGNASGSAYVFRFNGSSWVEEAKLTASDAAVQDYFGSSVAISGDVAVVGALYDSDSGESSGSAYVYRYNGSNWVEEAKLTASDAAAHDCFGFPVAISGDVACVGANRDDDGGTNSGSAYVFAIPTPALGQDCNGNGIPDECDIEDGISQDCNQNGLPDECDISAGTSQDCNRNGIPDECDIAFGTSQDSNSNGIPDECEYPTVINAFSVKTHGTAGEFGIDVLDRSGGDDFECRKYGVTKLVVVFDTDIQQLNGDVTDVELSSSGGAGPPYRPDLVVQTASDTLTIEMSGTTNGVPLIVTFPGIAKASDAGFVCTDTVCIRQLVGSIRGNGSVNIGDRIDVRNQMGLPVTGSNFRADVRADGAINAADRIDVRNAIGMGFVGSCPYE